ncbi:MAG: MOSC domain-containing protein [Betaproteobacteria bacterium]|nr:MAG: MOSC domain-containing protein [Betaproteobacteria bacterium]
MRVAALYRYPVKGFTPESCETLSLVEGGRIAGDRVLGFRFANAAAAGDEWGTKHEFVALVNTPGLARLELKLDHHDLRLRVASRGELIADQRLDDGGRTRMAAAIERYVLELAENPLASHPERLPLRVVGDGVTPRYQDDRAGLVTLHSRESLAALASSVNSPDLSELRFRSNIAIEGAEPWAEQRWIGRTIRIGAVEFEVACPKTRCLATHANPSTGERDLRIMETLRTAFPAQKPTFAVALTTRHGAGMICTGDKVTLNN